jgi:hypothetical protein
VIVFFGKIIANAAQKKPTSNGELSEKTAGVLATAAAQETGKTNQCEKSSGWFRH